MQKPLIAVALSGVLVSSEPFKKAHKFGMKELAEKSGIKEISKSTNDPNYFKKVEEAIAVMYPELTPEERIKKRRRIYLSRVIDNIKESGPEIETINYLKTIRNKYRLALVTSVTDEATKDILRILNLENFFDFVLTTDQTEKDDKGIVINKMIKTIGKPEFYLTTSNREEKLCQNLGINVVSNLEDLKSIINNSQ